LRAETERGRGDPPPARTLLPRGKFNRPEATLTKRCGRWPTG